MRERAQYGESGVLPTPVFFYGMEPGEEISVDIERGKTLIVRYVANSEPHEDGTRTVFFELNGQPRSCACRTRARLRSARRRARPRRATRATSAHRCRGPSRPSRWSAGAKVARGDMLLTLEAMKMETAVRAESEGEVAEVLAKPGQTVDVKDLLAVLR